MTHLYILNIKATFPNIYSTIVLKKETNSNIHLGDRNTASQYIVFDYRETHSIEVSSHKCHRQVNFAGLMALMEGIDFLPSEQGSAIKTDDGISCGLICYTISC